MRGQFIKKDRLDFTGIIANDCKGTIVFPDQYSKSFTYIEEEYKIVWGNELNGEVWNKGKNFPSLGLIQVKDPSQKKKKSYINNNERDYEKYSIRKSTFNVKLSVLL